MYDIMYALLLKRLLVHHIQVIGSDVGQLVPHGRYPIYAQEVQEPSTSTPSERILNPEYNNPDCMQYIISIGISIGTHV